MAKTKFTQFGMYPRLFVKEKSTLYPIIEKYHGSAVSALKQGQIIKIYFNLLRSDSGFRGEIDALISAKGSKLYTLQQRVMNKVGSEGILKGKKTANKSGQGMTNFIENDSVPLEDAQTWNNDSVTPEDVETWDEATFVEAITYEENQEGISTGLKIVGVVLLIAGLYYGYKYAKGHKILK